MQERGGAGQQPASIDGLGSWKGVRPVLWVRVGTAAGAISYLGHLIACAVTGSDPIGEPISEAVVVVVCGLAFLIAPRRPALAAAAACGIVGLQVLLATVAIPTEWVVSPPVLPVVVLAMGLFFGARASLGAAGAAVVVYPLVQLAAGRIGPSAGVPPLELSRLVTVEFSVAASGILTWLALRTLARVHAEAEERRALESRLQQGQRLLVVGELAGVAAHDLRNILGVVYNTSSLLSSSTDADARRLGAELLQSARRGQEITQRLLSLGRRADPHRSVIDVARAVEALEPLVTRLIGPRCTLELSSDGAAPAVADPTEVEQVVLNLAANARDAMAGAGRVTVRVRSLPRGEAEGIGSTLEATRQILVEVGDQGTGIAPELRERIFEPFMTTKPRGEGTGLGLATVRAIASASGGTVTLESAPGAGSTFRVFLPEAVSPGAQPAPAR